jgi:hypothetical protein
VFLVAARTGPEVETARSSLITLEIFPCSSVEASLGSTLSSFLFLSSSFTNFEDKLGVTALKEFGTVVVGDGVLIRLFANFAVLLVTVPWIMVLFDEAPAVLGSGPSFLVSVLAMLATLARRSASLSAACSLLLSFWVSLGSLTLAAEAETPES